MYVREDNDKNKKLFILVFCVYQVLLKPYGLQAAQLENK